MKTSPLNNNVLIRVTKEYAAVSRMDENETLKTGVVVSYSLSPVHLTASAGLTFDPTTTRMLTLVLDELVGKTVRWEELADTGQTFVENDETYASIPFWRLISVTEE